MIQFLHKWQTLVGSVVGAATPFILWWFSEKYRESKKRSERLYFFDRMLVDRINNLHEIKKAMQVFLNERIPTLISGIRDYDEKTYALDWAFFPLFSREPIEADVLSLHIGSGYIDNKLGHVFRLSKDFSQIIEDSRRQFEHTIEINKLLIINKLPLPASQKESYVANLEEFKLIATRDIVEKNINTYMKCLIETRIALAYFNKQGFLRWRIKFDPKYRFFMNSSRFNKAKESAYYEIEDYFKNSVQEELKKLGYLK